jgi:hypothetical protein
MHVFYAQGGGLGHLTRIDKIIKTLDISVRDVIIITPSIFTHHFVGYRFVQLLWNEHHDEWIKKIELLISKTKITSFYVDTFPYGLKGELKCIYSSFPKLNYIYISRVLKWESYLEAMSSPNPIAFKDTLLLEKLYDSHLSWIEKHSEKITPLCLDYLQQKRLSLLDMPYVLVVHSGGKSDVLTLCNLAIKDFENKEVQIIVFTQVDLELSHPKISAKKNQYPVAQYFENALHIYTAAGFNSIQELQHYKQKHTALAFKKQYDDQHFRLNSSSF